MRTRAERKEKTKPLCAEFCGEWGRKGRCLVAISRDWLDVSCLVKDQTDFVASRIGHSIINIPSSSCPNASFGAIDVRKSRLGL